MTGVETAAKTRATIALSFSPPPLWNRKGNYRYMSHGNTLRYDPIKVQLLPSGANKQSTTVELFNLYICFSQQVRYFWNENIKLSSIDQPYFFSLFFLSIS